MKKSRITKKTEKLMNTLERCVYRALRLVNTENYSPLLASRISLSEAFLAGWIPESSIGAYMGIVRGFVLDRANDVPWCHEHASPRRICNCGEEN
jgi:hypothetical protein